MRVAHVIKVTGIAGAERHLLMLLSGLRARHVDAHLVIMVEPDKPMDDMIAEARKRNIPIHRVTIYKHYDLLVIKRLRRLFRILKPDIVHTHLLHADWFGIVAAKLAGVRVVLTGRHNDDAFRYHHPIRTINWLLWRIFTGGTVISEAIHRFSAQIEGAPLHKLHLIRYGIEHRWIPDVQIQESRRNIHAELELPDGAFVVGMVSRLVNQKGIIYGLHGIAELTDEFEDLHLLIAGDGSMRTRLETTARLLGIADRVHFLGWRTDISDVMAAMDVFLFPSLWEGFGLVLLESMVTRIPVIASDVSAIPEIVIHGQTGFLVPVRDSYAIAEALRVMFTDRAARRHMGLLAEDRVDQIFNAARMVDETHELYCTLHPDS